MSDKELQAFIAAALSEAKKSGSSNIAIAIGANSHASAGPNEPLFAKVGRLIKKGFGIKDPATKEKNPM